MSAKSHPTCTKCTKRVCYSLIGSNETSPIDEAPSLGDTEGGFSICQPRGEGVCPLGFGARGPGL